MSANVWDFLTQSFQQYSIVWLLVSAGIGGFVGAGIKFLFEQVWGPSLQSKRATALAIAKYTYPLLHAADSLDRRIENLVRFVDKHWYDDPRDDYYRLSMRWLIGCYLGWCKILETEAGFFESEGLHRKARTFSIQFYRVFKGITGFYYFTDVKDDMKSVEAASIPRFALTAIGELMIKNDPSQASVRNVLDFVEFTRKSEDPDFKKWFAYVNVLLSGLTKSKADAKWNRLLVFAINLRVFVEFLDPKHDLTAPRRIYYLKYLDQKVAARVEKELVDSGFDGLIDSESRTESPT